MELINDDVSRQIINSAKKLAQNKNLQKINVRDILNDLNITNRVFYNRFHNVDEVLECIYSEAVNKVRRSLDVTWSDDKDYFEHILEVVSRTLLISYETKQNVSQYIFEADSEDDRNYIWWNEEINKLVVLGQHLGKIKSDIDIDALNYSIWCFIRGFNADALARNISKDVALKNFRYGFSLILSAISN